MHPGAISFCERTAQRLPFSGTEFNGLRIGDSEEKLTEFWPIHWAAPDPRWDYTKGPFMYEFYDMVLCANVLERVSDWHLVINHLYQDLKSYGFLILVCAGPYHQPETNLDNYYGNIHPMALHKALQTAGFKRGEITYSYGEGAEEIYLVAYKN